MQNSLRLKVLVAAIGMATASVATAATTKHLHQQNLGNAPVGSLASQLNLGAQMSLVARSSVALPQGRHVVRHQQMYQGVPVYGRSVAVVEDAQGHAIRATGELMQMTGSQLAPMSVVPHLSAAAAINCADGACAHHAADRRADPQQDDRPVRVAAGQRHPAPGLPHLLLRGWRATRAARPR